MKTLNIVDIMTEKPLTVHLDDTVHEALRRMDEVGCHHLPVVGTDNHLVGIVSERDCRLGVGSPNMLHDIDDNAELADTILVRQIMTPAPIVVAPHQRADEAARLMLSNHIGCLPVMREETLIGIITRSDILMAFMMLQQPEAQINKYHKSR